MAQLIKVTAGIIFNNKHEILIAKRGIDKDLSGHWEFPGGKVEKNESPEQCLIREIKEEFDMEIIIIRHFLDSTFHYPDKSIFLMAFLAKTNQLDEPASTDHDEVKWITTDDLNNFTFAPADVQFVRSLKSLGKIW